MDEINKIDIVSEAPDFSMFGLFMQADIVVKSVIIILIIASIYSWSIIVTKLLRIRQLKQMEIDRLMAKEELIEDRKDKRTKIEGTQQSEMINQRNLNLFC